MKIFVFLFPQFNFSTAPKEEAYFKMLGEDEPLACRMKESHLRNKDKKSRLSLLLAKSGSHENVSPEKKPPTTNKHIPPDEALKWSDSFEDLLSHSDGVEFFTRFLRTEFSEENIEFWLACEDFKSTESSTKLQTKARQIYAVFIDKEAPKEVNIDHSTKTTIEKNVLHPTRSCFDVAQDKIYSLMKRDCYPRFLTSDIYLTLTKRKGPVPMTRRRSRSFVLNDRAEGTAAWL
ncbi:regulator of G-protein signaling 18 isoform X1 [Misgurnus anguillicaudatus]|uniref:regulator of G-protein signaling 18 isoform X1 n=2 Tax=Misgurnus anguillicaudatus TaxID=75329 RepID=UPI002435B397|nr:regulator of G-protein signaling 18 isoform X1 [Misgurnus anguillicaudatus]